MLRIISALLLTSFALTACAQNKSKINENTNAKNKSTVSINSNLDTATFANGCFWCTEAIFQQLEGVESVRSGYTGGSVRNPTYQQVSTGNTGHAEALEIFYDPKKITYDELLEVFWKTHDPTTLNRQGNDVGTQYRSVVYYHNENQKALAAKYKMALDESGAFDNPVVTTIEPSEKFYVAEDYHQNYYNENGSNPYCQMVVRPKLEKFKKAFKDKLKKQ